MMNKIYDRPHVASIICLVCCNYKLNHFLGFCEIRNKTLQQAQVYIIHVYINGTLWNEGNSTRAYTHTHIYILLNTRFRLESIMRSNSINNARKLLCTRCMRGYTPSHDEVNVLKTINTSPLIYQRFSFVFVNVIR